MNVCPVCEHAQPGGAECEVCGKRLGDSPSAANAPPPLEGLEPTRHAPIDAPEAPIPDLERTHHAPAAAVHDPMPDIEETRAAPVDVDAPSAPDVERFPGIGAEQARTALPAVPVCRYCRTPAAPGERICARCGMRLPIFGGEKDEAPAAAGWRCSCGTLARGSLCPTCGARRSDSQ